MQKVNQATCFKLNKYRNAMNISRKKGPGPGAEGQGLYIRAGGRISLIPNFDMYLNYLSVKFSRNLANFW